MFLAQNTKVVDNPDFESTDDENSKNESGIVPLLKDRNDGTQQPSSTRPWKAKDDNVLYLSPKQKTEAGRQPPKYTTCILHDLVDNNDGKKRKRCLSQDHTISATLANKVLEIGLHLQKKSTRLHCESNHK